MPLFLLHSILVTAMAWAMPALAQQPLTPPPAQSQPPPVPPATPSTSPQPAPSSTLQAPLTVAVVIDPGHGGADAGARGSSGILEKDVAFSLALHLRAALERQGLRAVLTREAATNPSFDDRAALANAHRGAVLIALHASSVGRPGTARAYYHVVAPLAFRSLGGERDAPRSSLVRWEEAQQPYISSSQRLAEMIQSRLRERFADSPPSAASAPLRDLRSIAGPAVAVEVASVSAADQKLLDQMVPAVADAIARAVAAFRAAQAATASPVGAH